MSRTRQAGGSTGPPARSPVRRITTCTRGVESMFCASGTMSAPERVHDEDLRAQVLLAHQRIECLDDVVHVSRHHVADLHALLDRGALKSLQLLTARRCGGMR
jgi:hypothetical protein